MTDDTYHEWDMDDPDDCRELARRVIRAYESMVREQRGIPDAIPLSPLGTLSDDELDEWIAALPIPPA